MRRGLITCLVLALVATSVSARIFDHKHKGFVDGMGIGGGLFVNQGNHVADGLFSYHISVGWGFGDRDMILTDRHVLVYSEGNGGTGFYPNLGIVWHHYWFESKKTFSRIGVTARDEGGTLYNFSAGLGYEFRKHLAVSIGWVDSRHSGGNLPDSDQAEIHLWYLWY